MKRMSFQSNPAFSITNEKLCLLLLFIIANVILCGGARNFRVKGGIGAELARGFNHLLMCVGTGKAGSGEGIKMIVWQNCLIASKLCTWLSGEEKADVITPAGVDQQHTDVRVHVWQCTAIVLFILYYPVGGENFLCASRLPPPPPPTRRINWQLLGSGSRCVGQAAAAFRHTHLKIHAISTRSRARKIKMHALDARGAAPPRLFHPKDLPAAAPATEVRPISCWHLKLFSSSGVCHVLLVGSPYVQPKIFNSTATGWSFLRIP